MAFVAGALLVGASSVAEAGSLDLNSSMSAMCVGSGGSCARIRFTLNVPSSSFYADAVRIFSNDAAVWSFMSGGTVSVWDGNGNPIGDWGTSYSILPGGSGIEVFGTGTAGAFYLTPIVIEVEMDTYSGTTASLYDGTLTYSANGYNITDNGAVLGSLDGTVTPEPVSMVLLGTGLIGVAGAARRRRKRTVEDLS